MNSKRKFINSKITFILLFLILAVFCVSTSVVVLNNKNVSQKTALEDIPQTISVSGTLAKDSPDVEVVDYGKKFPTTYASSLKATKNTTVELWGYSGQVMEKAEDSGSHAGRIHKIIYPKDNSLSGNIGCWFRNVGTYNGQPLDVKCTYYWQPEETEEYEGISYY